MKRTSKIKRIACIGLIFLMSINSFATSLSDNDGSAFITKAEFDALKSSFQAQIDAYNQGIDSKIDTAIASYLAGIKISKTENRYILCNALSSDGFIYAVGHSDLGFTAGWPNVNLAYTLGASTKNYGGTNVGLGFRAHALVQSYTDNSTESKFGKRLYLKQDTYGGAPVLVYDGLYKVKDNIDFKLWYSTSSIDIGFGDSTWTVKLSVLTSHNTSDTAMTLNTYLSNLYWTIGNLVNTYNTSNYFQRLYASTRYEGSIITNKIKNEYPAVILNEAPSSNAYLYWIENNLLNTWKQPSYTSTDAYQKRLYYVAIDTMWPSLSSTWSYSIGADVKNSLKANERTFDMTKGVATVGTYDNEYQRRDYTGRCWPIRTNNGTTLIEDIFQNDKTVYEYKKDDKTTDTLTGYTLNSGVPLVAVEKGDKVKWVAEFVDNDDTTSLASTTLAFRYGRFDDASSTEVTSVTYDATKKQFSFTATKNGIVFVKWSKGTALNVSKSREVEVELVAE